jgi:NAD(P)-dependent dehydrogenase (short-subunit alcohol dehydrogenase family)
MAKTFNEESTTDQVLEGIELSGKRVLVTGASAGLGVETVRAFVAHGASVVGAVRDTPKAKRALESAFGDSAQATLVDLVDFDLASLRSVRKAADHLLAAKHPFDLIICNAGIMACPQGKTEDGFEAQFGANHLGHFVLINRLAPLLKENARVIVLSSAAHRMSDINLDDPNFERTEYEPWQAYGRSKTANALCALGLDRRLRPRGVRAASVHPGVIQTELMRHLTPELSARITSAGSTYKTVPQGAATSVWAAIRADAAEIGGRYCEDCHVANINDDPKTRGGVRSYAQNEESADALWALSERMVGERFGYN